MSHKCYIVAMIQMTDLAAQHYAVKQLMQGAFDNALSSSGFIGGPAVAGFESEMSAYLGCGHVISCASGTDALLLAIKALGIGPGHEVIVPDFCFAAPAEAVLIAGAVPVLADTEAKYFCIDAQSARKAINPSTKAIICANMFGQAGPLKQLAAMAREHGIWLIEDNAQATGANIEINGTSKMLGTVGSIGCFSFFPSKNLGACGDGGAAATDNPELAAKMRMLANHGSSQKYWHEIPGHNSRLDSLQAAFLSAKLPLLDSWNIARQQAAEAYNNLLASCCDIILPHERYGCSHVYNQYTLRLPPGANTAAQVHLRSKGISSMVYYPHPMHKQPAYAGCRYAKTSGHSGSLCSEVLSLPMHPFITHQQIELICSTLRQIF
jgi:UDP-2-acetamido-2-deoxy-ribo-hexuluronate aminotransferase